MTGVTSGAISRLKSGSCEPPFILEVKDIKPADSAKCHFECADGSGTMNGAFVGAHLVNLVQSGDLKKGSLVKVIGCSVNVIQDEIQLFITALEVVDKSSTVSASGEDRMEGVEKQGARSPEPSSPSQKRLSSNIEIFSGKAQLSPLQALNPYGRDWRLKAKVVHKFNKQSYSTKEGEDCSRFSAHIVDEHGTQAEITFWREVADKYFDSLEEKKVYVFSKFTVKPANRNYSSLSFDYALNMGQRSEVHECVDQDITDIEEKIDATKLAQLPKYLGRQVPVSVMGVLLEIGNLGTVKRKSDNTEVSRRDVTIVDESKRSVVVTLWNPIAEKVGHLEPLPHPRPVLAITMCRVSDFNGLSLNTSSRSALVVNPDIDEARELQNWYTTEGQNESVAPLGEGLDNSRLSSGVAKRHCISDLQPLTIPPLEAKPQYGVVQATITYISTEQSFFYLGNTENFKKVIEQNGKYYCESDGKEYDSAMHRYVVNFKVMDSTGECWLSVFNDQMEGILGITADELAAIRTADEDAFRATVTNAQWQPHVFRIAGRSRQDLKTNELRMRHTVVAMHNFSWGNECRIALETIQKIL